MNNQAFSCRQPPRLSASAKPVIYTNLLLTILAVKRIQQYWYISCFETVVFHYDPNSTAENLSVGIRSRKQCFSCGLVTNRNWDCDCQDCRAQFVNFWILSTLWLQNKPNNFITDWSGHPISSKDLWVSRI